MFRTATFLLLIGVAPLQGATTITLLHFSDYHSHALPLYSEGSEKGGIARAIGFMERHKQSGALVLSGGDMMNKGAPAWSDKYRCAEWAWFNGIVDAMAFGNHDADYGNDELDRCRATVRYPILSANTTGFERYRVLTSNGVRIGVFAIAGPDFAGLVTGAKLTFTDPVTAAKDVVNTLRNKEHVDAVVMIGHEHAVDDEKLAAAVPGIDLILGSHTHLKRDLTLIQGTHTWFISPFQYLTYVSVVEMDFNRHKLTGVRGRLVPVDNSMEPDAKIAERVATMEHDLESDPAYRDLFAPIAKLPRPMEVDELARFALDTMRTAGRADVAISTASSFRQPLPAGLINLENLRVAMPYDNEILLARMGGLQLEELFARAAAAGPSSEARAFATPPPQAILHSHNYAVAVTDYMARVSPAYRDLFPAADLTGLGARVRSEVSKRLGSEYPPAP